MHTMYGSNISSEYNWEKDFEMYGFCLSCVEADNAHNRCFTNWQVGIALRCGVAVHMQCHDAGNKRLLSDKSC